LQGLQQGHTLSAVRRQLPEEIPTLTNESDRESITVGVFLHLLTKRAWHDCAGLRRCTMGKHQTVLHTSSIKCAVSVF
jgi:hypothetical protein